MRIRPGGGDMEVPVVSGAEGKERYRLLYDGACPICSREVLWLHCRRPETIEAVDIAAEGFDAARFGLTGQQVDAALYGIRPDGSVTVGMDSLREAYRLAGLGWLMSWTGWWPARPAFDAFYRWFARNRMRIGRLLGRQDDSLAPSGAEGADNCRF